MKLLCISFLALAVASCAPKKVGIEIPFVIRYQGQPISCTAAADGALLTDLRFFVTDMRLVGRDGSEASVDFQNDGFWQTDSVALLDFEDGEGACVNGTPRINVSVKGHHRAIEYAGLSFAIGIPAELNHANPLTAVAPLSFTDMHWHWTSGYKFLRAGLQTANDGFWLHLGSNRCSGTSSAGSGCQSSNRPRVLITEFVPGTHSVILDLGELFVGSDLTDGVASDCSSGPAEEACIAPFAALGLHFDTGETIAPMNVFSAGRIP